MKEVEFSFVRLNCEQSVHRHDLNALFRRMILRRRCSIIVLALSFFTIVLLANIYFVYIIIEEKNVKDVNQNKPKAIQTIKSIDKQKRSNLQRSSYNVNRLKQRYYLAQDNNEVKATINATNKIQKAVSKLAPLYRNISAGYKVVVSKILKDLQPSIRISPKLWKIAEKWVTGTQVIPENVPLLGSVLNTLCSSKIIKADNSKKGTQLKVLLTLEGGQKALFKPQWYLRDEIINGPVYAGRDRHNAEVAAFHLSLLLNIRQVPLIVGRKVNLRREIMPVATPELLDTFYQEGNNTCFYGVCMYCEPQSPVCAKQDTMEGAVIMWLPSNIQFERFASPWQRSYKSGLVARWEVEENYCEKVKNSRQYSLNSSKLLLDLIDAAIFDFLLDNGDRHHYEVPLNLYPASVFLFDNGKSFGNPHRDHMDILAPLYQCCMIRRKTWERLKLFTGGTLSSSLEQTLKYSHISPVLTNAHLHALDRRLLYVFAAVEICIQEKDISHVLV